MGGLGTDDVRGTARQFTARAAALFTAVAILGLVVLVGVGAAGALTYSTLTSERDELVDERDTLASQRKGLEARLGELESGNAQLQAKNARLRKVAAGSFARGVEAGRRAERAYNETHGLTYAAGRKVGRNEIFASWVAGWQVGGWYVVQIGKDDVGLRFSARFSPIRTCELMYIANGLLYKPGGSPC